MKSPFSVPEFMSLTSRMACQFRDHQNGCSKEMEALKNSKKPHFVQTENVFKEVLLVMCFFS